MRQESVEFSSDDGLTLRGTLARPDQDGDQPYVVMTQGAGGHKEWYLPHLAELFAEIGIASLAYDNRSFGASDGEPRCEIDPILQVRDYRSAITFVESTVTSYRPTFGIFGSSLSGGVVLNVAAIDRRVACVVSQVPYLNGFERTTRLHTPDSLTAARERWLADRRARSAGGSPEYVPHHVKDTVDPPSNRSLYFEDMTPTETEHWENRITLRSQENLAEYIPAAFIEHITPTPLMLIVSKAEAALGMRAYAAALEPKRVVLTEGDHYDVYMGQKGVASSATRDWFGQWLLPS